MLRQDLVPRRALYRTLELTGANPLRAAHAALGTAVLALNLEVATKIEQGSPVNAPGVLKHFPEANKLVTADCIRPSAAK